MNRDKQKIISDICPFYKEYGTCDQCNTALAVDDELCYWECMANAIINNGYRKASDVAREIFEEIELLLDTYSASHHSIGEVCGESYFERGLEDAIAELKKKYESEGADDET